jgi:hypothetical protein
VARLWRINRILNIFLNKRIELILCLVCLVNSISLAVFSSGMIFASEDDLYSANAAMTNNNIWRNGFELAKYQGRFYQTFFSGINQVAYVIEPNFTFDFLKMYKFLVALVLSMLLFLGIYKLLPRTQFLIFCSIFAISINLTGPFNPLVSLYPWFFSSLVTLVWSAVYFRDFIFSPHNKKRNLTTFIALNLYTLFSYEIYVFAIFFYVAIYLYHCENLSRARLISKEAKLLASSYTGTLLIYFISYFYFRYKYPSSYTGSKFGLEFNYQSLNSLSKLTFGYFNQIAINRKESWSYVISILEEDNLLLLAIALVLWALIPMFIFGTKFVAEMKAKSVNKSLSKSLCHISLVIAVLLLGAFSFNMLLAFSEKYSNASQVILGTPYTSSLPSLILLLIAISILFERFFDEIKSRLSFSHFVIALVFAILPTAIFGFYAQSRNVLHFSYWSKLYPVWEMNDRFLSISDKQGQFRESRIYSSSLAKVTATTAVPFWENRFSYLFDKEIKFIAKNSLEESLNSEGSSVEFFNLECGIVGILVEQNSNSMHYQSTCSSVQISIKLKGVDSPESFILLRTGDSPSYLGSFQRIETYELS